MATVRLVKCKRWGYNVYRMDSYADDEVFWRPTWKSAWKKAQKLLKEAEYQPWYIDLNSEEPL